MWFKNIRLYALADDFTLEAVALAEAVSQHAFRPCSAGERSAAGWVNPVAPNRDDDRSAVLTHELGNYVLVCLRKQEKILPAAVVNEEADNRIQEIETRDDRKVYRKEKLQIKDDVVADLLPRAFSRHRVLHAYIDLKQRLLVVNTSSAAQAEELISSLRDALGSFPVRLLDVNESPMAVMTGWLRDGHGSDGFQIDQDCELINPLEDGNVIRCKSQDLTAEEVTVHLEAGKQVKKLGVVWNEAVSCHVSADLTLSRVRFEDMVLEKAREADAEDAAQQFDQDFAVMTLVVSDLSQSLVKAFGGSKQQ
ncbi:recombination-associated protein RdgC [Pseudohongiella sp. O18]|uniref:recombination-associated protein RdgC n=1 Tax=Pseudohongiella sp. O18 TaxID=2904248 RepID=UPI001F15FA9D|nr:recombination-associated protein RdgC [Pseudohongiella sp. O18]